MSVGWEIQPVMPNSKSKQYISCELKTTCQKQKIVVRTKGFFCKTLEKAHTIIDRSLFLFYDDQIQNGYGRDAPWMDGTWILQKKKKKLKYQILYDMKHCPF